MTSDTKTISLKVTTELDRQLRMAAAQLDQNRSEFIRDTLAARIAELQEAPDAETEEVSDS